MSSLSKRSIETLVDLVEIKLSCLDVFDREDAREKACLENARRELVAMMAAKRVIAPAPAAGFGPAASPASDRQSRRRGLIQWAWPPARPAAVEQTIHPMTP